MEGTENLAGLGHNLFVGGCVIVAVGFVFMLIGAFGRKK